MNHLISKLVRTFEVAEFGDIANFLPAIYLIMKVYKWWNNQTERPLLCIQLLGEDIDQMSRDKSD